MAAITQWDTDARPRERLRDLGPAALSNAELLAIIIGGGTPGMTAVDVMKSVLADHRESLAEVGKLSIGELSRYRGIGEAKAISILAACELGRRRSNAAVERQKLASPEAIFHVVEDDLRDKDTEEAWIVLMNRRLGMLRKLRIGSGGFTDTNADVRIALRECLVSGAVAMALCHNHPSGNPYPSANDDRLTQAFKDACKTMRIDFVDHIIVADRQFYSYRDEGKL